MDENAKLEYTDEDRKEDAELFAPGACEKLLEDICRYYKEQTLGIKIEPKEFKVCDEDKQKFREELIKIRKMSLQTKNQDARNK